MIPRDVTVGLFECPRFIRFSMRIGVARAARFAMPDATPFLFGRVFHDVHEEGGKKRKKGDSESARPVLNR